MTRTKGGRVCVLGRVGVCSRVCGSGSGSVGVLVGCVFIE